MRKPWSGSVGSFGGEEGVVMFVGGCAVLGVGITVLKLENPDTDAWCRVESARIYIFMQRYVSNYTLSVHCYQHLFQLLMSHASIRGTAATILALIFDALVRADTRPQALLARAPDAV